VGLWAGLSCGHHKIILAVVSLVPTIGHVNTCDLCNLCNRAEPRGHRIARIAQTHDCGSIGLLAQCRIVGFWVGLCCGHHSIILAAVSLIPTTGNADTCDLCNLCDRAEQPVSGVSRTMHPASWCRWVCCENAALIPTQQPHPAPHPAP
jgi:hypothetical protein